MAQTEQIITIPETMVPETDNCSMGTYQFRSEIIGIIAECAYFNKKKFLPGVLADEIIKLFRIENIVTPTNRGEADEIWMYNEKMGIYTPTGKSILEGIAEQILGTDKETPPRVADTIKLIKIKTYKPTEEFKENLNYITCLNGWFNIETRTFEKFSDYNIPPHISFSRINAEYRPEADCPAIKKFAGEVAPEQTNLLQEWNGYCLLKRYPIQQALMLVGEGANGKSTYLNLVKTFLGGKESVSSNSLMQLEYDRFAPAELYNKMANIQADLGYTDLKKTAIFKALTGGDQIKGERKYQHAFYFTNYAKLLFSTNALPKSIDDSYAFFRRWCIIQFTRRFEGANDDKDLLGKLTTPEEMSGLLNWTLEGLYRILENGKFSTTETVEETKQRYVQMSNTSAAFINKCLEEDLEANETKEDVYRAYNLYCKDNGLMVDSETAFVKELKATKYVLSSKQTIEGERHNTWRGIRLRCGGCEKPCKSVQPVHTVHSLHTLTEENNVDNNIGGKGNTSMDRPDTPDTQQTLLDTIKEMNAVEIMQ